MVVSGRVGTRTKHFLAHISNVINVLNRNNMKGNHLVMDNAPIHTAFEILELVESRGEKYLYLPTCSPFLIPLRNFGFGQK
jgi:transposase